MTRPDARPVQIKPSLGLLCVKCQAPGTIAMVRTIKPHVDQISAVHCQACQEIAVAA